MILVVTFIYLATAAQFAVERNWGMSLCFFGYCAANIGIVMSLK